VCVCLVHCITSPSSLSLSLYDSLQPLHDKLHLCRSKTPAVTSISPTPSVRPLLCLSVCLSVCLCLCLCVVSLLNLIVDETTSLREVYLDDHCRHDERHAGRQLIVNVHLFISADALLQTTCISLVTREMRRRPSSLSYRSLTARR